MPNIIKATVPLMISTVPRITPKMHSNMRVENILLVFATIPFDNNNELLISGSNRVVFVLFTVYTHLGRLRFHDRCQNRRDNNSHYDCA